MGERRREKENRERGEIEKEQTEKVFWVFLFLKELKKVLTMGIKRLDYIRAQES